MLDAGTENGGGKKKKTGQWLSPHTQSNLTLSAGLYTRNKHLLIREQSELPSDEEGYK